MAAIAASKVDTPITSGYEDVIGNMQSAGFGIELEYMIVDRASLEVMPVCDRVLVIYPNADAGGRRNNFKSRVVSVAPWGLEYKVELDCGFTAQAAVTKQLVDGLGLKPGCEVYASFKATAAHLIKRAI